MIDTTGSKKSELKNLLQYNDSKDYLSPRRPRLYNKSERTSPSGTINIIKQTGSESKQLTIHDKDEQSNVEYYYEENSRKLSKHQVPVKTSYIFKCRTFTQLFKLRILNTKRNCILSHSVHDKQNLRSSFKKKQRTELNKSCDCSECGKPKKVKTLFICLLPKFSTRQNRKRYILRRFRKIVTCIKFIIRYKIFQQAKLKLFKRKQKFYKPYTDLPIGYMSMNTIVMETPQLSRRQTTCFEIKIQPRHAKKLTQKFFTEQFDLQLPPPEPVQHEPKIRSNSRKLITMYNLKPRMLISSCMTKKNYSLTSRINTQQPYVLKTLGQLENQFQKKKKTSYLSNQNFKLQCLSKNKSQQFLLDSMLQTKLQMKQKHNLSSSLIQPLALTQRSPKYPTQIYSSTTIIRPQTNHATTVSQFMPNEYKNARQQIQARINSFKQNQLK